MTKKVVHYHKNCPERVQVDIVSLVHCLGFYFSWGYVHGVCSENGAFDDEDPGPLPLKDDPRSDEWYLKRFNELASYLNGDSSFIDLSALCNADE